VKPFHRSSLGALVAVKAAFGCSLLGEDIDSYQLAPCKTASCLGNDASSPEEGGGARDGAPGLGGSGGAGDDGGDDSTDSSHEVCPRPDADASIADPPLGALWDRGASAAVIPVCFTATAHREWNCAIGCTSQTPGSTCSGEAFAAIDEASLRTAFRAVVENSWMRVANLDFRDFGDCPVSASSGKVELHELPRRLAVTFVTRGAAADAATRSVTGRGKHDAFASDLHVDWIGLRDRDPEAVRLILREVGRVLGFSYEWVRPAQEIVTECYPRLVPDVLERPTLPAGLVDRDSVMDRCNPVPNPKLAREDLSPGDVIGASFVYGRKPWATLVGERGQCLGVENDDHVPGTPIVAAPCRAADGQFWVRDQKSRIVAKIDLPHWRSMSVKGPATGVASLETAVLSDGTEQRFLPTGLEWRAMGSMCLEATNDFVVLNYCDGSLEQRWDFWETDPATPVDYDQIRSSATGECVSTLRLDSTHEDAVVLGPCDPNDARQKIKPSGQQARLKALDFYCLNVLGGLPVAGSLLGLFGDCSTPDNFVPDHVNGLFSVSGPLHNGDRCVTLRHRSDRERTVSVESCDGSPEQDWDYHF
jgi:hypothetical protein